MIKKEINNLEKNRYVGGHNEQFQDPAMDRWVTIQSLNDVSRTLREVNDRINNRLSLIISTILTIFTAFFLGTKNWVAMIFMLILLEIWTLFQLKRQLIHRRELQKLKPQIIKVCQQYGIKVPKGDLK